MAKAREQSGVLKVKASAGWFNGVNSYRLGWLIADTQYRWGVNSVCRGGIIQTRPGYRMRLSLPPGNLQGMILFKPNKEAAPNKNSHAVFAVDGKVYAAPFPLTQPTNNNWEPFRLKNIQFSKDAKQIFWAIGDKSAESDVGGNLKIIPTFSVLMMQDGISSAAFWDGELQRHLKEDAPDLETPKGTWMAFSGGRLWLARGKALLASDILDPLSFRERITGETPGDFNVVNEITGIKESVGSQRKSVLVVFTEFATSQFLSFITDRTKWASTEDFQTVLYPSLGCVSGRSIVNLAGLLWWYSHGGLVSSDSAATGFITSEITYKDMEMANSKRNFAPDLSGIAGAPFENYLLMSVPSGDPLNAHTMVLDYATRNDLFDRSSPAWNGVWTGTRPVEWATDTINGTQRIFFASVDYQSLNGTFNHIWEAFDPSRMDTYDVFDINGNRTTFRNPIYGSYESKLLGDTLDLKMFKFAELDLVEIGGEVNLRVCFGGSRGGYNEILRKRIIATLDAEGIDNPEVHQLFDRVGEFRTQSRRVITSEPTIRGDSLCDDSESPFTENIDKYFGLYVQWCGRMGIEAFRFYTEPKAEKDVGACEPDENGINIVTPDGQSFQFEGEQENITTNDNGDSFPNSFFFVSPFTPKYREVFYSSIPVDWQELPGGCVTCLPCARDTFTPPDNAIITIQGKPVS